jgi:hypothetical protein
MTLPVMKIRVLVMNGNVCDIPVAEYDACCRSLHFKRDGLVGFDSQWSGNCREGHQGCGQAECAGPGESFHVRSLQE